MLTVAQAVALRENPETLDQALPAFQEILKDYESRGESTSDIWGHITICYKLMAQEASRPNKGELFQHALDAADSAFGQASTPGAMAIARGHLAALMVATLDFGGAIDEGRHALADLPGSQAHRAWVHNMIAQGYAGLGNNEEALHEIAVGEEALKTGHDEEMKQEDGPRKLAVWWAGLMITKAQAHINLANRGLAVSELKAVLDKEDPEGYIAHRKAEAQEMLDAMGE